MPDAEGNGGDGFDGDNDLPLGIPFSSDQPIGLPDRFIFAPSIETADPEEAGTEAAAEMTEEMTAAAEPMPMGGEIVPPTTEEMEVETTPAATTPPLTTAATTTTTAETTTTREVVLKKISWLKAVYIYRFHLLIAIWWFKAQL